MTAATGLRNGSRLAIRSRSDGRSGSRAGCGRAGCPAPLPLPFPPPSRWSVREWMAAVVRMAVEATGTRTDSTTLCFLFARGGEEVAALQAAGVPFEIVPGITSAVAVPAYAGVPVTYRGLASSFTIVTGQEGEAGVPVDWEAVARVGGTVAVIMGVAKREEIARRLMAGGLPAGTPVAAITWGTRPEQHTCRTTLGRLAGEPIESPAVMLIGAVAALDLPWYEERPLF